jgi:hypothetical protein
MSLSLLYGGCVYVVVLLSKRACKTIRLYFVPSMKGMPMGCRRRLVSRWVLHLAGLPTAY